MPHNVSKKISKDVKRNRTDIEKLHYKLDAWSKNKNPWLSVDNPNTNQTNKRKIRVRANEYWGEPKPKRRAPAENTNQSQPS